MTLLHIMPINQTASGQTPSGLFADLYELTMAAGYVETNFDAHATFDLFARSLPPKRNFLVAAGLEQVLEFLENVRFHAEEIDYLRKHPAFAHIGSRFFSFLETFRFSGDVMAMPEGTVCFPGEPMLTVSAPIAEAQLVETALLATVSFQTMIASKAARMVEAAAGRPVIEFGGRRAHGIESAILAARAAYIGGCLGTSIAECGRRFGIPTYGTQAHSWIMAHETEQEAFAQFLDLFPQHSVLLLDTYEVRSALEKIVAMGRKPRGVRLDSGDLAAESIWVRNRLDAAGWGDVEVFVSGDLNEERIASLLAAGARVDTFGVGTSLSTSSDAPSLSVLYKLVEIESNGVVREAAKFSAAKVTYPGRKQVYRSVDSQGKYAGDVIALTDETAPQDEKSRLYSAPVRPLLAPVMRAGRRVAASPPLAEAQTRCREEVQCLAMPLRALTAAREGYSVRHSERLEALLEEVRARVAPVSTL
jgi:nicotinate phosphoribosyltransferase